MITHASVDLCTGEAVELITALRSRFRFSPNEFKSGQFLRNPAAGEALEWLLAALRGRAHVHLVDKEYFLITRIVDLLLAEPSYTAGTRLTQDQRPAALSPTSLRDPPAGFGPEVAGKGPAFGGHPASGLPALSAVARRR